MDSRAVATHNSTLEMYEGENKSASEVRALIQSINDHNLNDKEKDEFGIIETIPKNIDINSIKNTRKYNINITEYNEMGAVKTIEITELY